MAPSGESLRAEARRRGVTVYRVRVERGKAQGYSRAVSVGHPHREDELLSVQKAVKILQNNPKDLKARNTLLRARRPGETETELWTRLIYSPERADTPPKLRAQPA